MNKTIKNATKFILVGAVSTAVNYFCFYVLIKSAVTGYISASVAGYLSGLIVGYFLNNFWTFQQSKYDIKIITGYCIIYVSSLGLSTLFLWITVHQFQLNKYIMNIGAIGLSTITNFLGLNMIVYKNDESKQNL